MTIEVDRNYFEKLQQENQELKEQVPKWHDTSKIKPGDFCSVIIYVPSQHPLPTCFEGYYVRRDGLFYSKLGAFQEKDVEAWTEMPARRTF